MVEITSIEKNGRVFHNLKLNHLGVGEEISVTLLYDKPRLVSTPFGQVQSFLFRMGDKDVSTMIPASFKGEGFGVAFGEQLCTFKRGDILGITKKMGKMKKAAPNGKSEFAFYSVVKKGFDEAVLNQMSTPSTPKVNLSVAPKVNVSLPPVQGKQKTALVLTDFERAVVDAIKTQHPEYNTEQIKAVLTNNDIAQARATQILTGCF